MITLGEKFKFDFRGLNTIIYMILLLFMLASISNVAGMNATVTGDDGYGVQVSAQSGDVGVSLLPDPSVNLSLVVNRTEAHVNDTVAYSYTITAGPSAIHNLSLNDSVYGSIPLPYSDLAANQSMTVEVDRVPFFRAHEVVMNKVTIFSDGFESGNFVNWSTLNNPEIDSATVHAGNYSGKISSNDAKIYKIFSPYLGGVVYFDFWIRLSEIPSSSSSGIRIMMSDTTPYTYYILIPGSDGHWKHMTSSIVNLPIDTTYVANQWYHIEMKVNILEQKIYWYIDGESKGNMTLTKINGAAIPTNSTVRTLHFYKASGAANAYFDDVIVSQESSGSLIATYPLRRPQGLLVR